MNERQKIIEASKKYWSENALEGDSGWGLIAGFALQRERELKHRIARELREARNPCLDRYAEKLEEELEKGDAND